MIEIFLQKTPNQSFSFNAGGKLWAVELNAIGSGIATSVWRDGVQIISGHRVLDGEFVLPFNYMLTGSNLAIYTGGEDVSWEKFGKTQALFYIDLGEI